jgi:hypothetical protein
MTDLRKELAQSERNLFSEIKEGFEALENREWVGLTDEEVKDIVWNLPYEPSQEHIRAIEAKLREKNT